MISAATPLKLLLGAAGIAGGVMLFQHAMSHALHIVIASEVKPVKTESAPISNSQDCNIALTWNLSSRALSQRPCTVQLAPLPKPQPVPTMTKEQSEEASLWFILAAFAFPLSLGAAGAIAYLLFRTARASE